MSQQGSSSGDTTWDPTFVPWNIVQCRDGTQLRLDLTEPNANGVIIMADIYLLDNTQDHIFFTFRNKGNLAMGFKVEIDTARNIKMSRSIAGSWGSPLYCTNPLTLSKFNLFLCLIADFYSN